MNKIFPLAIAGMLMPAILFSQGESPDAMHYKKNELGIDAAEIMPLFRRKDVSYLLNYKRYFNRRTALRSGLNFDYGTASDKGTELDFRLGIDRQKEIGRNWLMYYGADASIGYTAYNDRSSTIKRWGISPLIGIRFRINNNFSIATEPKLNYFFYQYRDPESFSESANTDEVEIKIGSIGLILVNFHF